MDAPRILGQLLALGLEASVGVPELGRKLRTRIVILESARPQNDKISIPLGHRRSRRSRCRLCRGSHRKSRTKRARLGDGWMCQFSPQCLESASIRTKCASVVRGAQSCVKTGGGGTQETGGRKKTNGSRHAGSGPIILNLSRRRQGGFGGKDDNTTIVNQVAQRRDTL